MRGELWTVSYEVAHVIPHLMGNLLALEPAPGLTRGHPGGATPRRDPYIPYKRMYKTYSPSEEGIIKNPRFREPRVMSSSSLSYSAFLTQRTELPHIFKFPVNSGVPSSSIFSL